MYSLIKSLHLVCVVLSISGFVARVYLKQRESPVMKQRWIRVLPHINDTVLLGSALTMVIMSAQYPFVAHWLTAKVIGLLAYIALGVVALRGVTGRIRAMAGAGALLVFVWIISVAIARHPAGLLSGLLPG